MEYPFNTLQQNLDISQQGVSQPDVITAVEDDEQTPWRVMLFDDDVHTFEEVIMQLVKALHCETPHAEELTLKVHNNGKAKVFEGSFESCLKVNGVLEEIQLITEIKG